MEGLSEDKLEGILKGISEDELEDELEDDLEGIFKDNLEGIGRVFIKGEHGSGKTSIVCKIADNLREQGKDVLCLFAGSSTYSDNAQSLLDQIIFFIEDLLHQNHFTPSENEKTAYISRQLRLIELDKMIPEDKEVFLLVDAVDQLAADSHRDKLDFLPDYSVNIHYLVTCANDFQFPISEKIEMLSNLEEFLPQDLAEMITENFAAISQILPQETLPLLKEEEIGEVLKKILQRSYQRGNDAAL